LICINIEGRIATYRSKMSKKNVFVVGLDEFNRRKLEAIAAGDGYRFHPLLDLEEVTARRGYPLEAELDKAAGIIEATPGGADAIIGFWDFPVSLMVPVLAARFGLTAPRLEAVLQCEHKYWSRRVQQRAAPAEVPAFEAVDPFDDASVAGIGLPYPFWLKPIKSFASHLGFRIRNRADLARAIPAIRAGIPELGELFNEFLARVEVPGEVGKVDGLHCIAESIVAGRQCTLEGFVHRGKVEIYGVVDSIRHANRSSFARYQYPSRLPAPVRAGMAAITERVIDEIGLDDTPFNIEFFWQESEDKLWLLEINPRISQSHGDLFEKVDGTPHHRVLVELALGRRPHWTQGRGSFRCAGKFFLRRFSDAVVTRAPSEAEIAAVAEAIPGTLVEVQAAEGMRLSELAPQDQDSYSYICALIFIGADSQRQLLARYRRCVDMLPFEFAEVQPDRAVAAAGGR